MRHLPDVGRRNVSKEWSPKIAAKGCVVIDNSSAWRYDSDVPLIVPEVNADAIEGFTKRNIIANPNCSTAQLVVALKPLHDAATIKRIVVSTYQSVSGAGKEAMDELFTQTRAVFVSDQMETKKFTKRIAFNVIPHIDVFMEDGYTKEEWKVLAETKKMLDPKIKVTCTAVRVPVFIGHSEAVNIEFERPITADEARDILREAPGCIVIDKHEDGGYITPYESAGEDATFISRIREDATVENGLNIWVVSDNLRKGAALNTVQIAELLVNRHLISRKTGCVNERQPKKRMGRKGNLPAFSEDCARIAKILGNALRSHPWMPIVHTREEDLAFIRDTVLPLEDVTVAVVDAQIAGFIAVKDDWINQLYLDPGATGRGIGSALLEHVLDKLPVARLFCFQANTGACRFYERHGFVAIAETDGAGNEEHLPDIFYVREKS
jgi:aspartate-semialdehyde dehydrogenase